ELENGVLGHGSLGARERRRGELEDSSSNQGKRVSLHNRE
ncbi:hypothetical protein A2U01_0077093, partial [Trifolium medium]|nr:hypothetical protein [Trifolium medium]